MGYSKGYDKVLFHVGTHTVMYDKYQIVLQHPKECPQRGSRLDKRKTFHPWKLALKTLDTCGESLTDEQTLALTECGKRVAAVSRS